MRVHAEFQTQLVIISSRKTLFFLQRPLTTHRWDRTASLADTTHRQVSFRPDTQVCPSLVCARYGCAGMPGECLPRSCLLSFPPSNSHEGVWLELPLERQMQYRVYCTLLSITPPSRNPDIWPIPARPEPLLTSTHASPVVTQFSSVFRTIVFPTGSCSPSGFSPLLDLSYLPWSPPHTQIKVIWKQCALR